MTSVKSFVDVGDPGAPVGSPAWCKASHLQLCATKRQTSLEVRHLKYHLLEFKEKERWKQLSKADAASFKSWKDYVESPEPDGLGISVKLADAVIKATDSELIGHVLHNREIGIPGGKAGPGRGNKTGDNITRFRRGTSRAYILARLDRDGHDELAAKVRAHKISAKAASIEAGWGKEPVHHCPKCGHEW